MTRFTLAPLALLVAAIPAATLAQTATPSEPRPKLITRTEINTTIAADFADLDADKNGKVTRAEIEKRITTETAAELAEITKRRADSFAKLDTNKDGSVTKAEFEAAVPLPKVPPVDSAPVLARFDANKDGTISATEYGARTLANFDELDANKDGIVTAAEQQAKTAAVGR